jgi:hypothetical protein
MTQNAEAVGILLHGFDGQGVRRLAQRTWWMDHRAIDARSLHFGERIFGGIGRDLAMVRAHLALLPDMDLRIDDQHAGSLR